MTERARYGAPVWLTDESPPDAFPPLETALEEPNGLLAVGGDLSVERLLFAYRHGIFPWYSHGQPILWWSPAPRAVIFPQELKVSRRLARKLRQRPFEVTLNRAFDSVVEACSQPRPRQPETWITHEMKNAYIDLHRQGHAWSVECWHDLQLAGGIYGVCIGRVFFGESMFTQQSDASKIALAHLCQLGFELIDCQVPNTHLSSLGARQIERAEFIATLERCCGQPAPPAEIPSLLPDG